MKKRKEEEKKKRSKHYAKGKCGTTYAYQVPGRPPEEIKDLATQYLEKKEYMFVVRAKYTIAGSQLGEVTSKKKHT